MNKETSSIFNRLYTYYVENIFEKHRDFSELNKIPGQIDREFEMYLKLLSIYIDDNTQPRKKKKRKKYEDDPEFESPPLPITRTIEELEILNRMSLRSGRVVSPYDKELDVLKLLDRIGIISIDLIYYIIAFLKSYFYIFIYDESQIIEEKIFEEKKEEIKKFFLYKMNKIFILPDTKEFPENLGEELEESKMIKKNFEIEEFFAENFRMLARTIKIIGIDEHNLIPIKDFEDGEEYEKALGIYTVLETLDDYRFINFYKLPILGNIVQYLVEKLVLKGAVIDQSVMKRYRKDEWVRKKKVKEKKIDEKFVEPFFNLRRGEFCYCKFVGIKEMAEFLSWICGYCYDVRVCNCIVNGLVDGLTESEREEIENVQIKDYERGEIRIIDGKMMNHIRSFFIWNKIPEWTRKIEIIDDDPNFLNFHVFRNIISKKLKYIIVEGVFLFSIEDSCYFENFEECNLKEVKKLRNLGTFGPKKLVLVHVTFENPIFDGNKECRNTNTMDFTNVGNLERITNFENLLELKLDFMLTRSDSDMYITDCKKLENLSVSRIISRLKILNCPNLKNLKIIEQYNVIGELKILDGFQALESIKINAYDIETIDSLIAPFVEITFTRGMRVIKNVEAELMKIVIGTRDRQFNGELAVFFGKYNNTNTIISFIHDFEKKENSYFKRNNNFCIYFVKKGSIPRNIIEIRDLPGNVTQQSRNYNNYNYDENEKKFTRGGGDYFLKKYTFKVPGEQGTFYWGDDSFI